MKVSIAQRCVHHPAREAVARCPECARFFCRECVSEHDDRVLCARCLASMLRPGRARRSHFAQILRGTFAVLGIATAWWFFDLMGRGLILLPSSVHEGKVWEEIGDDE